MDPATHAHAPGTATPGTAPHGDPRDAYLAWCRARNKALVAAHGRGTSLAALGRQYGISRQRAWTIVARHEARRQAAGTRKKGKAT